MRQGRRTCLKAASSLILFTIMISGCLGGQTLQQDVTTEYLLSSAGFQKLDVSYVDAKREALMEALPIGKISTYMRDGQVYHAYVDGTSRNIYIGDEAAYQRYLVLAGDRKVCERVTGANQVQFWSCMEGYQQPGMGQPKK